MTTDTEASDTLTEDDLDRLVARYTAAPVPTCTLCGGVLTIGSIGGGRPTVYACSDRPREDVDMGDWYDHYTQSRWTQYNSGDTYVLALIAEVRAQRALAAPTEATR